MLHTAAHKWYVQALGLLALLLAAAAAAAQLLEWKGGWSLTLGALAIAVGVIAGFVDKVIVPRIDTGWQAAEDAIRRAEEGKSARAVGLMLFAGEGKTFLGVTNNYPHEVTEICIECWPLGGPPGDTSTWPKFVPNESSDDAVAYDVVEGGGQIIRVARLVPPATEGTGTGIRVGSWRLVPGGVTRVEFTVDWLDHDRRGRRLCGVADLEDFNGLADVRLNPPEPLTTSEVP